MFSNLFKDLHLSSIFREIGLVVNLVTWQSASPSLLLHIEKRYQSKTLKLITKYCQNFFNEFCKEILTPFFEFKHIRREIIYLDDSWSNPSYSQFSMFLWMHVHSTLPGYRGENSPRYSCSFRYTPGYSSSFRYTPGYSGSFRYTSGYSSSFRYTP